MLFMASFFARTRTQVQQLRTAYTTTAASDPRLLPVLVATAVITVAVAVGLGFAVDRPVLGAVVGLLLAVAITLSVFGRRASGAAMAQIEGRPGAAAAVLQSMRQPWRVTPAVAFSGKQDMVHRAVGRPGVVLVGEGRSARVTALLRQEAKKVQRVVGDTPVHEIRIGNGEDDVSLSKLRMHLMRLPRAVKKSDIAELERRLSSVGSRDLPLPKGPMPTSRRRPRPR